MNTTDSNQLLSYDQAAKFLSISLRQFRRLVDEGKFRTVRVSPRTPRILMSELIAFIAAAAERRGTAA